MTTSFSSVFCILMHAQWTKYFHYLQVNSLSVTFLSSMKEVSKMAVTEKEHLGDGYDCHSRGLYTVWQDFHNIQKICKSHNERTLKLFLDPMLFNSEKSTNNI